MPTTKVKAVAITTSPLRSVKVMTVTGADWPGSALVGGGEAMMEARLG